MRVGSVSRRRDHAPGSLGPVGDPGSSDNMIERQARWGVPRARVLAIATVIAHYHHRVRWNDVGLAESPCPTVGALPRREIGLVEQPAIDIHLAVTHQHYFSRQPDHPFDIVFGSAVIVRRRGFQDDDITT